MSVQPILFFISQTPRKIAYTPETDIDSGKHAPPTPRAIRHSLLRIFFHFLFHCTPPTLAAPTPSLMQVLLPWGTPRSRHYFLGGHHFNLDPIRPTKYGQQAGKFSYELPAVSVEAGNNSSTRFCLGQFITSRVNSRRFWPFKTLLFLSSKYHIFTLHSEWVVHISSKRKK